jgi:hypothetical protein
MTEADWQACRDPEPMLRWVGERISARKQRLFACACCRRVAFMAEEWTYDFRRDDYRRALTTAERFADGAASADELSKAHGGADDSTFINQDLDYAELDHGIDPFRDVASAEPAVIADIWHQVLLLVREFGTDPAATGPRQRHDAEELAERATQAELLRDLLGNPFRPTVFDPGWRSAAAVQLAAACYESGTYDRLPILADALEDAGCHAGELLAHLRGSGIHARGCWAVDLLLGKE